MPPALCVPLETKWSVYRSLGGQELMTRHKSTVAEYLSKNYEWVIDLFLLGLEAFFLIFLIMGKVFLQNLIQGCYHLPITSQEGKLSSHLLKWLSTSSFPQLLGDMLLDRSNSAVMVRYVSSKDNLMILMNLLRVCLT
ncbi:hypothetical protein BHM03_00014109 [Ensete ventricosum]|nr:hypothetical protein BHM03_00014109 [Ensete ventricosum]